MQTTTLSNEDRENFIARSKAYFSNPQLRGQVCLVVPHPCKGFDNIVVEQSTWERAVDAAYQCYIKARMKG